MRPIKHFTEVLGWLCIAASPALAGALGGFLVNLAIPEVAGMILGLLIILAGILTGGIWPHKFGEEAEPGLWRLMKSLQMRAR